MSKQQFKLTDPPIALLFKDLYRSIGDKYWKMQETRCKIFPIKRHLMLLGISSTGASKLLAEANLPVTKFTRNRTRESTAMPECVRLILAEIEKYCQEDSVQELGTTVPIPAENLTTMVVIPDAPAKRNPRPLTEEQLLAKDEAKESKADKNRYQFVETNSRYGKKYSIWDAREAGIVFMSHTQQECVEEMARLRAKRSFAWPIQRYRYQYEEQS